MAKEPSIDEQGRTLDPAKEGGVVRKGFKRTEITVLLAVLVVLVALAVLGSAVRH